MSRRPTAAELDHAAAIAEDGARVTARAEALLHRLLAVAIGVGVALALLHWVTPCAASGAALCAAPILSPRQPFAPAWLRRLCRRLHIWLLRTREQQLLSTAAVVVLDPSPDARHELAALLVRAAAYRLHWQALERG